MKLPSNKASLAILAIIILSTLVFISSDYLDRETPNNDFGGGAEIVVDINIDEGVMNSDSDGDGLMNWEEILWGTDPNNPDTDGDGTDDLTEIKTGRNPTIAGPNDEDISPEERILREIEKNSELDEEGLTNLVAIDFVENYFLLRGTGEVSATEKENLVNNIVNDAIQNIDLSPVYKSYSLETFGEEEYFEKLPNYVEQLIAKQLSILNTSNLEGEINYIGAGNSMIDVSTQLMNIETPKEIATSHIELANTIYHTGSIIKEFSKEDSDPLYVMMLLPTYEKLLDDLGDINNTIGEFLQSNDIIIEDNKIQIQND